MFDKAKEILLVGAGKMSIDYARVLTDLGIRMKVLGRGDASARTFAAETGVAATTGDLTAQLDALDTVPDHAIVAVNAMYLAEVTKLLAARGVRRMLVEKPGALDLAEMHDLLDAVTASGAEVFIAYNRRFLASTLKAREFIARDGGVLSVKFDFSEPSRRIAQIEKPQRELTTWFYGNSSHVVDMAFHFFGMPTQLEANIAGGVSWHPAAGVFVGNAVGDAGKLMSWHANWISPGRWGLEVLTPEHRLIFQPLEQLRVQSHAGFSEDPVELDLDLDKRFKPGLMRQTRAFLFGEGAEHLPTLADQARMMQVYDAIRTGQSWKV